MKTYKQLREINEGSSRVVSRNAPARPMFTDSARLIANQYMAMGRIAGSLDRLMKSKETFSPAETTAMKKGKKAAETALKAMMELRKTLVVSGD